MAQRPFLPILETSVNQVPQPHGDTASAPMTYTNLRAELDSTLPPGMPPHPDFAQGAQRGPMGTHGVPLGPPRIEHPYLPHGMGHYHGASLAQGSSHVEHIGSSHSVTSFAGSWQKGQSPSSAQGQEPESTQFYGDFHNQGSQYPQRSQYGEGERPQAHFYGGVHPHVHFPLGENPQGHLVSHGTPHRGQPYGPKEEGTHPQGLHVSLGTPNRGLPNDAFATQLSPMEGYGQVDGIDRAHPHHFAPNDGSPPSMSRSHFESYEREGSMVPNASLRRDFGGQGFAVPLSSSHGTSVGQGYPNEGLRQREVSLPLGTHFDGSSSSSHFDPHGKAHVGATHGPQRGHGQAPFPHNVTLEGSSEGAPLGTPPPYVDESQETLSIFSSPLPHLGTPQRYAIQDVEYGERFGPLTIPQVSPPPGY